MCDNITDSMRDRFMRMNIRQEDMATLRDAREWAFNTARTLGDIWQGETNACSPDALEILREAVLYNTFGTAISREIVDRLMFPPAYRQQLLRARQMRHFEALARYGNPVAAEVVYRMAHPAEVGPVGPSNDEHRVCDLQ